MYINTSQNPVYIAAVPGNFLTWTRNRRPREKRYFRTIISGFVSFPFEKIERNIERDRESMQALLDLRWKVIRVWECELRNKANREVTLNKIYNSITSADRIGYILTSSWICTSRSSAILRRVSRLGWIVLVHHLETVAGDRIGYSFEETEVPMAAEPKADYSR